MSPPVATVRSDDALPRHADVVIVGGGIIGVCTAYYLAEQGLSVALLEKGRIAGEQSSRNWGFVRQQGRDPLEIPLIKKSMELWEQFEQPPSQSVGFRRAGVVYLSRTAEVPQGWRDWIGYAGRYKIESYLLDAEEANRRAPSPLGWTAGLYTPEDAMAEPGMAVPSIAERARGRGVSIHQNCAVLSLETRQGKITAAVTEKGRISADKFVCAAGAWSSRLCRSLGIALPQLAAKASVMRTEPAPNLSDAGGISADKFSVRRRLDGGYNIARPMGWTYEIVPDTFRFMRAFWPAFMQQRGSMKLRVGGAFLREVKHALSQASASGAIYQDMRILDPVPDESVLDEAFESLRQTFPQMRSIGIAERWAGMIDIMPDAVPVIGAAPQFDNLILSTGFSGHGFGLGPGAARLTADIVAGGRPVVDPAPFRFERLKNTSISADVSPVKM